VNSTSPQQDQLLQRLGYVENALLSADPQMKQHLAEIHKLLIGYEELVHLLSEEQIGIIMAAQQKLTNTSLVAAVSAASKKASVAKKAGQLTLGDL
jgi:hypothetical protein